MSFNKCSVHLAITSPPYNVGKAYDDKLSMEAYEKLLEAVFAETHRVLVPGGRFCINIANIGRKPYIPLHASVIRIMQSLGYWMRGEIIWDKGASAGSSCAWGSWRSPSNPVLRDVHEYILVYSKDTFSRRSPNKAQISGPDFMTNTQSVWRFSAQRASKVGHPAPFPVELPKRLINLYAYAGDTILDPFCGSGTTCIAAKQQHMHYVGYDNHPDYVTQARKRLKTISKQDDIL